METKALLVTLKTINAGFLTCYLRLSMLSMFHSLAAAFTSLVTTFDPLNSQDHHQKP